MHNPWLQERRDIRRQIVTPELQLGAAGSRHVSAGNSTQSSASIVKNC